MPESVDVTKMKVADLKRELKIRGLSITGNKTELSERLQAALIDGELSLDDTAISGEELLDEDGVLTDEEEKILNENELLASPRMSKDHELDLLNEKDTSPANTATSSTKKIVLKRKISTNILSDIASSVSSDILDENLLTPSKLTKKDESTNIVALPKAANESEAGSTGVKKITQLSEQERLEMRAKKFGLNKTAEIKDTTNSEVKSSEKIVASNDAEASVLKKRAERFGCVVSSKMVQLDEQDRLQKRKQRFGDGVSAATESTKPTTTTTTTTTTTEPKVANDVWAEKARLRLERFKSNETKNINA